MNNVNTIPLSKLTDFLDRLIPPNFPGDPSLNGLQVDSEIETIRNVSFAVDSGEAVIQQAIENHSQLLVVHHGLFWGSSERLTGALARKVKVLMGRGCSLYASHLPLDSSLEVGNAAELAKVVGLESVRSFAVKGSPMGIVGEAPQAITCDQIVERCATLNGFGPVYTVKGGQTSGKKIAIVTGSGAFALSEASRLGVEIFISGEPKQEVYHLAHELGITAIFLGHYATETLGVLALKRRIEQEFSLATNFINIPTGI